MQSKTVFLAFARQNRDADQKVLAILDSHYYPAARQEANGSYYGSLEGAIKHILGGTLHFLGMFRAALKGNSAADSILAALDSVGHPDEKPFDVTGWEQFKQALTKTDAVLVKLVEALNENDFDAQVKVEWFGGNPATVPFGYLLSALASHGIHHRGQISQVFDAAKIDNDYSGINIAHVLG
ncbi:hypothetical protein AGMMS50229_02430 [Campylobacterota bacterium]|nr:hypothetical protein AGMMS50229_02430 [Campylobacterota bacterium]